MHVRFEYSELEAEVRKKEHKDQKIVLIRMHESPTRSIISIQTSS